MQADRRLTFRLYAPRAESVRLNAGDIPGIGAGAVLTKAENGVWTFTTEPVPSGAYRYTFVVDGVSIADPRSPAVSESVGSIWSLVTVPGSEFMDTRNVLHGAVASVTYYANTLGKFRRMHIYTPPGYEQGKAKPMIVIMPAGHTRAFGVGGPPPPPARVRPQTSSSRICSAAFCLM